MPSKHQRAMEGISSEESPEAEHLRCVRDDIREESPRHDVGLKKKKACHHDPAEVKLVEATV